MSATAAPELTLKTLLTRESTSATEQTKGSRFGRPVQLNLRILEADGNELTANGKPLRSG
jgi:hypothetical protein